MLQSKPALIALHFRLHRPITPVHDKTQRVFQPRKPMKRTHIPTPHRRSPQILKLPHHPIDIRSLRHRNLLHGHLVAAPPRRPANHGRPHFHPGPPPFPYPPHQSQVLMRPNLDYGPAPAARARHRRRAAAATPREGFGVSVLITIGVIVLVVVRVIAVEIGRRGGVGGRGDRAGVDEREDGVVLAQGVDGIADEGHVAAPGAGKGGVGAGGEHFGETLLAEAMAALEQERNSLLLVVPRLADRATRHFHLFSLLRQSIGEAENETEKIRRRRIVGSSGEDLGEVERTKRQIHERIRERMEDRERERERPKGKWKKEKTTNKK